MSFSRLLRATIVVGVASFGTIFACGGNNGGGGGGTPDAPGMHPDAPGGGGSDAPGSASGLMGLGEKCGSGLPACPANAPDCIALGLGGSAVSTSYCTPHCLDNGSGTTNGSGELTTTTPPPSDAACSAAYTGGSAGMPACGVILSTTPMDNPLKKNTTYTGISLGCVVACGSAAPQCPTGMTCNTTVGLCFPN